MMSDSIVRARIDANLKTEVSEILASIGLSLSDAIRLLLVRIQHDRKFPFELKSPNPTTVAAMKAARRGGTEEITLNQLKQEWDENL